MGYRICLTLSVLCLSFRILSGKKTGDATTIHLDKIFKGNSSIHSNLTTTIDKPFPPPNYDSRESGVHGRPQDIKLTVWIESIVNIDVSSMEYVVHGYIIQEWYDARLNGSLNHPILLSKEDGKAVWLPDLYCLSCRSSTLNTVTNPNVLIKIFPNGNIYYSQLLFCNPNVLIKIFPNGNIYYSQLAKLVGSCFMNLYNFPFDNQICPMNFSSYGYDDSLLSLHWKSTPIVEKMQLEQFIVNENVIPHSSVKRYPSGNYTILSFELFFTRQVGFYVLQVYIPSIVLVSLSWMTFFMEPTDVGDRLSIGVTLILTMIFLLGYINQSLPKVSYIKAIDWYVIASLFMIVTSVIESVLVYWLLHRKEKEEKKKKEDAFEKFDRYLNKKLSMESSTYNLLPMFNNINPPKPNNMADNNQQAGSFVSNLSSLGCGNKPFYPTMKTLSEENEPENHENGTVHQTNRNGSAILNRNNNKPIFAKFENDKDLDFQPASTCTEESEETDFINNKNNNNNGIYNNNKITKPFVRNRGNNNKFRNHRNSLHASRHSNKPGSMNNSAARDTNEDSSGTEDEGDVYQNLDKIYKLDIFARTFFPLFYVLYTLAYFIYYFGAMW